MITIENTEVFGWEAAIRGMRNPMNSWGKSDGDYRLTWWKKCKECDIFNRNDWDDCETCELKRTLSESKTEYMIGPNDLALMKKLAAAGSDHRKYLRMITVYADVTAPLYWWKEYDTYKVGTVANSCSTMHKIHEKEFNLDDFSHEHLTLYSKDGEIFRDFVATLEETIDELNVARRLFVETNDKKWWWQMIQLLPSSYNQRRTVMLNYEVLRNMYHARKVHKLDEWVDFCKWIEGLPHSELITGKDGENNG